MGRSPSSWRYQVMKHYLHRVQKFKTEATTIEEMIAWSKVESWFKTILEHKRLNWKEAIGLPELKIKETRK